MANMKKIFIAVMVIGLTFTAITAYAQSAKEAIMGLKKLEARCQSGISYRDYSSALGEAKFPVNLYKESKEASKNIKLTESILRAMGHYERAGSYWSYKFSIWELGVNKDSEKGIIEIYPDADKDAYHDGARTTSQTISGNRMLVDFLLRVVWREAGKELANASNLYSQAETELSNETENLRKENEKLKAENSNLKKQLELMKP